jgi:hypothetical protein
MRARHARGAAQNSAPEQKKFCARHVWICRYRSKGGSKMKKCSIALFSLVVVIVSGCSISIQKVNRLLTTKGYEPQVMHYDVSGDTLQQAVADFLANSDLVVVNKKDSNIEALSPTEDYDTMSQRYRWWFSVEGSTLTVMMRSEMLFDDSSKWTWETRLCLEYSYAREGVVISEIDKYVAMAMPMTAR